MSDIHFDSHKASLYNLLTAHFNDEVISSLFNNYNNNNDIFYGINDIDERISSNQEIKDIITNSIKKAEQHITNLTPTEIDKTVKNILGKLIKSGKEEQWCFFNKKDLSPDKKKFPFLFDEIDYEQKYENLPVFSSNNWNTAICTNALANWSIYLKYTPETNPDVFNAIARGFESLTYHIQHSPINKYPYGFVNFYTTCDLAYVLKTYIKIRKFALDYLSSEQIAIDRIIQLSKSLISAQLDDSGWPFAFGIRDSSVEVFTPESDIPSTCYTLLLLSYLNNYNIYSCKGTIISGLNYLLTNQSREKKQSFHWKNSNGTINIEVTCVTLQILEKNNIYEEYAQGIKLFLQTKLNENISSFIRDDIEKIENSLEGNAVKLTALSLITLLKSGCSVVDPIISIPFSWLLKRSSDMSKANFNKTNLISIICCISEYLSSQKAYFKSI